MKTLNDKFIYVMETYSKENLIDILDDLVTTDFKEETVTNYESVEGEIK